MKTAFALLTIITFVVAPIQAQDTATIVQATMLADTTTVQPDTTFTLGVLFKVQPGWHIYWKNPGSSGLATKVTWTVPEGGSAGETQYPAPIAFTAPGDIVSYGYEGEVLLLTEARVSAQSAGSVTINAKCRWLMCSDRCIPGKQDVSIQLPVGKGQPANKEVFDKYRVQVPKAVTAAPQGVEVKRNVAGNKTTVQMSVAPPSGAQLVGEDKHPDFHQLFFFPGNIDGVVVDTPKVSAPDSSAGGVKGFLKPATITFTMEPTATGGAAPKRVNGVLVRQTLDSAGKPGRPEAIELDLAQ